MVEGVRAGLWALLVASFSMSTACSRPTESLAPSPRLFVEANLGVSMELAETWSVSSHGVKSLFSGP